jgi:hypothetical protein
MESKLDERTLPSESAPRGAAPTSSGKRTYRKPEVVAFGNVRELTQGGGSKGQEPKTGQRRF